MNKKIRIAGIINVTPDSFSDGGKYFSQTDAINGSLEMLKMGVDIVDIGGESTRPGSNPISEEEEINRTIPVISGVLAAQPDALISIDTNKSSVAWAATKAGARMINDISGGTFDPDIYRVAAEWNVPYILMHTSGKPAVMQQLTDYSDVVDEVLEWLLNRAEAAVSEGVNEIIIDPGIGFGKTAEQNMEIINRIDEFSGHGFKVMIGLSRKSFLGKLFGYEMPVREYPSAVLEFFTALKGVDYIRTHNTANAVIYREILEKLNV
ncbi:MAG: dihydropteroate synthase [Ignavibacteriales bacterium]|nr:Dihydropteroate synthase [Ignavibacteriaceae bacterium]MBW7872318.1 dihydropteroate synthase [Ignavibacteria bacterium]MBZ0196930.1 dihydropteroate synthase [Ignavibacteriaceae bacterium]MCZ2142601.1 dihydropteroate synthase [Ignavibacteriales bacterium]WKZ73255.1 MAG: dihydropteroate synthase [Ignavibacteriaceae bacterium]